MKHSKFSALLCTLLGLSITIPLSFASEGSGHSGGGGGILCINRRTGVFSAVTADYFEAALPTIGGEKISFAVFAGLSESEVVGSLLHALRFFPAYQTVIREQLAAFGEINDWIAADLKKYDDAKLLYDVPSDCRYVQLAIREDEALYANPDYVKFLNPQQRGFLRFHESVYQNGNVTDSSAVRKFFRALIKLYALDAESPQLTPQIEEVRKRLRYLTGNLYLSKFDRQQIKEWTQLIDSHHGMDRQQLSKLHDEVGRYTWQASQLTLEDRPLVTNLDSKIRIAIDRAKN